jgi:Bacterial Ig-like domain (group 1)
MPYSTPVFLRQACAVLLIGALGCSSDLLLPDSSGAGQGIGALTKEKGDGQIGPVGAMLPLPLEVKVVTESQEPVQGVQVVFELADPAGGSMQPPTAITNESGVAVANWTLGTVPGSYLVKARLSGVAIVDSIAEFRATAHAGAPDTLSAQPPLAQPGRRQLAVKDAPTVRVADQFGNPVPNARVEWQVIYGEGQVTSPTTATDAEGIASVNWTLGNRIGEHKLTATIEGATGSPVTFTATVFF